MQTVRLPALNSRVPEADERCDMTEDDHPCQSPSRDGRRWRPHRVALLVLAIGALTLPACGESDEEKALNDVCDARADIEQKVKDLGALTPSAASVDQIEQDVTAIGNDVETFANVQDDLDDERKQQVETANQKFSSQLDALAEDLSGSLTGGGDAQAALASALDQLGTAHRTAYQSVDCS
jgi:hypothetical protein